MNVANLFVMLCAMCFLAHSIDSILASLWRRYARVEQHGHLMQGERDSILLFGEVWNGAWLRTKWLSLKLPQAGWHYCAPYGEEMWCEGRLVLKWGGQLSRTAYVAWEPTKEALERWDKRYRVTV